MVGRCQGESRERLVERERERERECNQLQLCTCSYLYASGVSDALFALGQYHFNSGHYHEAAGYFEKAAESANSCAQAKYQLGVMYYDGLGVREDPVSVCVSVLSLIHI